MDMEKPMSENGGEHGPVQPNRPCPACPALREDVPLRPRANHIADRASQHLFWLHLHHGATIAGRISTSAIRQRASCHAAAAVLFMPVCAWQAQSDK